VIDWGLDFNLDSWPISRGGTLEFFILWPRNYLQRLEAMVAWEQMFRAFLIQ
jgi:hypothetical protein